MTQRSEVSEGSSANVADGVLEPASAKARTVAERAPGPFPLSKPEPSTLNFKTLNPKPLRLQANP